MSLKENNQGSAVNWLDQRRGRIFSYTGGWIRGKGVYTHGYSMLEDLIGKKSYFQIMILNATGRLVERKLADWFESIFGCLSWPDPRIWCNQIGALAGAARTGNMVATVMGCLASDSRMYGPLTVLEGAAFIQQALVKFQQGIGIAEIVQEVATANGGKPYIVGYLRPIAKGDERLVAMEQIGKDLGISQGEHLSLAYEIEKYLQEHYEEGMNINGYLVAVLSDYGFSPQEIYQFSSVAVGSGVTACYLDTLKRPPNNFLPLRCDDMDYQGQAPRPVPER